MVKRGAHVLTFGRHEEELNQVLEEVKCKGGTAYGLLADVSRKEDILRIFHEVDEKLGGLDILINNAGLSADSILDSEYDEWQLVINTNVLGYMACCREAILRMRKNGEGHIINIGSMSADLREEESNVYVATKAAVQGFTEALRKAVNKEGIGVTLIEPGKVASDLTPPEEEQPEKKGSLRCSSRMTLPNAFSTVSHSLDDAMWFLYKSVR
jgi:NAD(P)-dependent dehydrogenase (short-subunit alcohol dehydrogenase family)